MVGSERLAYLRVRNDFPFLQGVWVFFPEPNITEEKEI